MAFFLLLGYALLTVEWALGWRRSLRWGIAGILACLLWALMLPAWLSAADPAAGVGRALGIGGMILFAGYLCQVASGRERLLKSALLAGLAIHAILALVQHYVVLPTMAAEHSASSLIQHMDERMQSDLAERIRNGGSYATFTLANNLGLALVLSLFLLSATFMHACKARWWLGILAWGALSILSMAALMTTGSKGAFLALGGGILLHPEPLAPAGASQPLVQVQALLLPSLTVGSVGDIPSVAVRLGYWQSAITLWLEQPFQGMGWGSFGIKNAAVMPVWAEWSKPCS